MFPCEFCQIFKNTYFEEYLRINLSESWWRSFIETDDHILQFSFYFEDLFKDQQLIPDIYQLLQNTFKKT